ncbi:MAG TPA: EAL domain-containing protein [Fluviicoccus sp.]|nr:EAL domain-containing protein [Fluviicoccus sp.]
MSLLRILTLEDLPTDAELLRHVLQHAGLQFESERVVDEKGFREALERFNPDIILADYMVPGFNGMEALALRNELKPAIPFIFVSGSLGEERAVETLVAGATDYVIKDRMARLPSAILRALEDARLMAQMDAERSLRQVILETVVGMIVTVDDQGVILSANPSAERLAGSPGAAITGKTFWDCYAPDEDITSCKLKLTAIARGFIDAEFSWRGVSRTGRTIVWTAAPLRGDPRSHTRLVLCGIDITDQQQAQEKAYYLDHFDAATGLPNRKLFLLQLQQYCAAKTTETGTDIAALMVCFDRTREIHDSYGEDVLQQILTEMVRRMRTWQVQRELLAHTGEQSFSLAFEIAGEAEIDSVIPYILKELHEPVEINGTSWVLPVHAGVAVFKPGHQTPQELVLAAEAALHDAQSRGLLYTCYHPRLAFRMRERLQLETELHQALQRPDQFAVYFQPQVDARSHSLIGLEALVRWRHPRLGLMLPGHFIPLAEVAGLMPQLGQLILKAVCRQMRDWREAGLTVPTVAINISAIEFATPTLFDSIRAALRENEIPPELLELELTESASMQNPDATVTIMNRLHSLGIRLSIDDFGTGYSNLSYLKKFPVDRLKLDQAFVRDILVDPDDLAISQAVIAMAHQLRLEVVAEGVEAVEQLDLLVKAGCDGIQGYLFSIPLPGESCVGLLKSGVVSPTTPVLPA